MVGFWMYFEELIEFSDQLDVGLKERKKSGPFDVWLEQRGEWDVWTSEGRAALAHTGAVTVDERSRCWEVCDVVWGPRRPR